MLDVLAGLPAPVDDGGPGLAFVRIPRGDRPERWFRRVRDRVEPLGLGVRCGAGANRFVAFVATHRAADAVCPAGREAAFVADAPLELLGAEDASRCACGCSACARWATSPRCRLRTCGVSAAMRCRCTSSPAATASERAPTLAAPPR